MKKEIVYISGLVFITMLSTSSVAQPSYSKSTDKDVLEVIQRLDSNILTEGDFTQTRHLQGFSRPIVSSGKFIYWKDSGLYWETQQPFTHALTYAPDEVVSWKQPGQRESATSNSDSIQRHVNKILLSIFGANIQVIEKYFSITWILDDETWSAELKASDPMLKKRISGASLSGREFIQTFKITTASNDVTEITFINSKNRGKPTGSQCELFYSTQLARCNAFR